MTSASKNMVFQLLVLIGMMVGLISVGFFTVTNILIEDKITAFTQELHHANMNIRDSYEGLQAIGMENNSVYLNAEQDRLLKVFRTYRIGITGRLYVMDGFGELLISSDSPPEDSEQCPIHPSTLPLNNEVIEYSQGGQSYIGVIQKSPYWDWYLLMSISKQETLQIRSHYLRQTFIISFPLFALVFFVMLRHSRHAGKKIDAIVHALEQVKKGDLSGKVLVQSKDEIGLIAHRINEMIVEIRSHNDQLEAAKQMAEGANEAKSVFLAHMSHELRTPLNAVLGFAQVLKRSANTNSEENEHLDLILTEGRHLLELINEILDISRLEAGKLDLHPIVFDPTAFLEETVRVYSLQAQEKGIELIFKASCLPLHIKQDEARLRQVVVNILSNAIKFTDTGSIVLEVMEKQGHLHFRVQDTGIGIASDKLENIFLPFEQAFGRDYSRDGTGLGLTIAREIVRMMRGEIHVHSTVGTGSTFCFSIQYETVPEKNGGFTPHTSSYSLMPGTNPNGTLAATHNPLAPTVLIADDSEVNRRLLKRILNAEGIQVLEAVNGIEAVELAVRERPALVLMDMLMPLMDGKEAVSKIREYYADATMPIVLITAAVLSPKEQAALHQVQSIVVKPYAIQQIHDLLIRYL
jgi:signal transduction histidine kinase